MRRQWRWQRNYDGNEIRTAYIMDPMTEACDKVKQSGKYPYEALHAVFILLLLLKSGFGCASA